MSTIGERLRIARDKSGLKQTQVKERTNINNKTLSGYENNVSRPDLETLKLLAELYGVSTDYLLGHEMKEDNVAYYKNRIAIEFPDIDLMFKDMESLTAEDMEEVYDYIKFKKSQKEK